MYGGGAGSGGPSHHHDTHAEAEAAKAAHQRPQDRDKPNEDDDLVVNDRVEYHDHSHGGVTGIIMDKLGRADDMLALNRTTGEGRKGGHQHEMIYRVLNETTGVERELKRSQLHKVGHREGVNPDRIVESVQPPRSGAYDQHPERAAPRRH